MGKNKLYKKLRKAAAKLPPATREVSVMKSGKEILALNPDALDKDGNAIRPEKYYTVKVPERVNHYRTMKKANKDFGLKGAADYFKGVLDAKEKKDKNKLSDATVSTNIQQ